MMVRSKSCTLSRQLVPVCGSVFRLVSDLVGGSPATFTLLITFTDESPIGYRNPLACRIADRWRRRNREVTVSARPPDEVAKSLMLSGADDTRSPPVGCAFGCWCGNCTQTWL